MDNRSVENTEIKPYIYKPEENDYAPYGIDQFGLPITKEDIKMNVTVGILGAIVFIGGLLLASMVR